MSLPMPKIKRAYLSTRSVDSRFFLLTEKFDLTPDESSLFYIIESDSVKIAKNIQKNLQEEIIKVYLASDSFNVSRLEESLHYLNKKITASIPSENSYTKLELNVIIGLIESNNIHLSLTGNIEGYLLRKGKISSITDGLEHDESEIGFFNITSGSLNVGDRAIIANRSLFNRLSLDRIRHTFDSLSPKQALHEFCQILNKSKNFDCNAVILQAVSPESTEINTDESMPEIMYVDEIIDNKFVKFIKSNKPKVVLAWQKTKDLSSFVARKSGASAKKIKEGYSPIAKAIVDNSKSFAEKNIGSISSKIKTPAKNTKNLKIKPYFKRKSKFWPTLFTNISKFIVLCAKKENRRLVYIALVIILILLSYLKIRSNNLNREALKTISDQTYAAEQADSLLGEAKQNFLNGDSGQAISKLNDALTKAHSSVNNISVHDRALVLIKDIQSEMDKINKTTRLYGQNPIVNFKTNIISCSLAGETIYAITDEGKIYTADSREKDPKLVGAIPADLGKVITSTFSDSGNVLLVLTDKPAVWAFDQQSASGKILAIDGGQSWEKAVSIAEYSSNIYLLDSALGKVWRHTKTDSGYSAGSSYGGSKSVAAKDTVSLAVDGNLFAIKPDGKIIKYSHSSVDSAFTLQAIPEPNGTISKASEIVTESDANYLYLLDQGIGRIIRYTKTGEFVNQYIIDGINPSLILHNPRVQKLWAVSDRDVYEIDL